MTAHLRKLEEIGGWVAEDEVRHHLGDDAVLELLEAETEGLVETRTYFSLTKAGQAAIEERVNA